MFIHTYIYIYICIYMYIYICIYMYTCISVDTVYQETGVPAISLPNIANSLPPDLVGVECRV